MVSSAVKASEELQVLLPTALNADGRQLLAELTEALLLPGGRRLTIDLARGRSLDTSLLTRLRNLQTSLATLNCELTVSASAAGPRRLLELTGLAAHAIGGTAATRTQETAPRGDQATET